VSKQRTCEARRHNGEPCRMPPLQGSRFCWAHDPSKAKERAEARKRGGFMAHRPAGDVGEVDLRDVRSVLALIERAIRDTLALKNSVPRNRAIGSLAATALKALEIGELERRIEALERALEEGRRWA